ncbi:hypothetical protein G6F58_012960 [Rhizopus delemar]|nr:hypothetical protein G6F58_012960 [Rhizopus delemar]
MVPAGSGSIINLASMYGVVAAPDRAAYCATKGAVVLLTETLAVEWGPMGVRGNALVGYGLVVGLDGSGDRTSQAPFKIG